MVHLVPITRDNSQQAASVRGAGDQLRFVAGHQPVVLVILAKAHLRVSDVDWWSLLVQEAGRAVGVLALADERTATGGLALFHLAIDVREQRSGRGRAALRAAVELAGRTPGCDRLWLTVHPDNAAAVALYRSEGFRTDGVTADGELRFATPTPDPGRGKTGRTVDQGPRRAAVPGG